MTEDKKSQYRAVIAQVVRVVAIGMAVFHLYTAQFGVFSAMVQRPVHLMFACLLTLLSHPISGKYMTETYPWPLRLLDWALCGLSG